MNPCPLDGTDPLARHVLAACIESDGPVDADGDQALVIDDARHPTFLPGGEAARPWDAATGALVRRPRRRRWALLHEDLRVGRLGPPFSSPQEPHCRDAVEGPSHV